MHRKPSHWCAAVLVALCLAACAATPRRTTLYDDLGGPAGVAAIVDQIIEVFADDRRVAPFFANSNIARFRSKLVEYICRAADGPCTYTGDSMTESHTGLGIDQAAFNAGVEDFQIAMTRLHVSRRTQNRLLARLAPDRKDIIYK